MLNLIIFLFIIGYLFITLEHPLKLDKTVPALLMAGVIWALLAFGFNEGWLSIIDDYNKVYHIDNGNKDQQLYGFSKNLMHHFGKTAEILIFLIGAMTIVEIIDLHRGFGIIKSRIKSTNKVRLLWTLGIVAFILSAIIDNLTATIVLVTLLRKLIPVKEYRIWFASMIIIAANAGGAWSPIGDVTTTMLWIGNKVTAIGLSEYVIVPSLLCFIVPFMIASKLKAFQGETPRKHYVIDTKSEQLLSSKTMLYIGLSAIVFVPIFKVLTGLPPYLGMMFSLGFVWLFSEYVKPYEGFNIKDKQQYSGHKALSKIEFSSILFFFGILMAVGALESMVFGKINGQAIGTLGYAAESLSNAIPNLDVVVILLGILSAIIDNVPLVAASMGMYDYEIDHVIWHFIAYCAGTGGSLLIIGSAAGVAAMGMERIDFIWYFKRITWLAFTGFIAGALCFLFIEHFIR